MLNTPCNHELTQQLYLDLCKKICNVQSFFNKKNPKHMTAVHSQKYNNNNNNDNNNLKEYHTTTVYVSLIYTVLLCSIFDKKITMIFFFVNYVLI